MSLDFSARVGGAIPLRQQCPFCCSKARFRLACPGERARKKKRFLSTRDIELVLTFYRHGVRPATSHSRSSSSTGSDANNNAYATPPEGPVPESLELGLLSGGRKAYPTTEAEDEDEDDPEPVMESLSAGEKTFMGCSLLAVIVLAGTAATLTFMQVEM